MDENEGRPRPSHSQTPSTSGQSVAGWMLIIVGVALLIWIGYQGATPDPDRRLFSRVPEAYRFAAAHADLVRQLDCYCGCKDREHLTLLNCFYKQVSKRKVIRDTHGENCRICLREILDAKRWSDEGKAAAQIRKLIVEKYEKHAVKPGIKASRSPLK